MIYILIQISRVGTWALMLLMTGCLVSSCNKESEKEYAIFEDAFKKVELADVASKEEAITFLDSAYYSISNPPDSDIIRRYLVKTDFYLKIKKDYGEALIQIDSLLAISESRLNNQMFAKAKMTALYTKGTIFYTLKNYNEALNLFVLSKRAGEEMNIDDCSYLGFSGIPDLLFKQEKYLLAAEQYLENYYIEERCRKDPWLRFVYMQGNLNSVGMCYDMAGITDSAMYFFDSASHFIDSNGKKFPDNQSFIKLAKSVVLRGQASILERTGKRQSAEELYIRSIEGTQIHYIDFTRQTKLKLAGLYVVDNNFAKSEKLLKELEQQPLDDDNLRESLYRLLATYYTKLNNDKSANAYMQKYATLKDTLDARLRRFASMDISSEFKAKEQVIINQLLIKENKAKSFQLTAVILLSLLAITTIAVIWFSLLRKAKNVKDLQNLNSIISLQKDDLQKAFNSLEQSHEENAKITRMIAHDLKNPIGGIKILASNMLKKLESQEFQESLTLIVAACSNSISLIGNLLQENKATTSFPKEMVDMNRLLQYCVNLLQGKADEKKQILHLQSNEAIIQGNRQKLWRVVSNVLNNAIKFSPDNSTIFIKLIKKEQSVLLSVEDSGIGISSELKDKIFNFHPETSRRGTAGEESHGLGLLISRNIVDEHNGKLWFESTEGTGTVFFVELPYES